MKTWQRLMLEPSSFCVLRQLRENELSKDEIINITGIEEERINRLLPELKKENLIEDRIKNGRRIFSLKLDQNQGKQLRIEIEDLASKQIVDAIIENNYEEAKNKLYDAESFENKEKRQISAKVECLQKYKALNMRRNEKRNNNSAIYSLKRLISSN